MSRLSVQRIQEAAGVIDPIFLDTPQLSFDPLSRELGAEVTLKIETLNPIRSFKGRGAEFYVATLPDSTPLVAASAGNFGQGLARAAVKQGLRIVVFAAENANPMKAARMRDLGAEVILTGRDFDAAKASAREYCARNFFRYVEDGKEPAISEGAGTIALELSSQSFDVILVPVGNGALINGIGTWMKSVSPATKIIGVCAAQAPSMEISWRSGRLQSTETAETIADGIAVRLPVPEALEDMRATTDDIVLVSEVHLKQAMRQLLRHTGLLVEPAGAAGIAALIAHRDQFANQRIATPLCGSNVAQNMQREEAYE